MTRLGLFFPLPLLDSPSSQMFLLPFSPTSQEGDYLWIYFFKYTVDQAPKINNNALGTIKTYFFSCKWNEVYDFIQFIANNFPWDPVVQDFMQSCNYILSRELSAYQFVEGVS